MRRIVPVRGAVSDEITHNISLKVTIDGKLTAVTKSTTYGVDELERMLGVRARTIYFWVQSGLLEGPGAGRGARYQDEHLGRLFLIRKLRAERRPLPEIAEVLRTLSAERV